jgi:hypothetical protein
MKSDVQIPEPFLFNPLKHHLGFIIAYAGRRTESVSESIVLMKNYNSPVVREIIKELKHLGTSVMDVYSGSLPLGDICKESEKHLKERNLFGREQFSIWAGTGTTDFRVITLSDSSQWMVKFHVNETRYIHIFPARYSPHTFRVKSNTLKSALLYNILIGKDFITGDDLNRVRPLLGLSPVKDPADSEAVTEMIEILRS